MERRSTHQTRRSAAKALALSGCLLFDSSTCKAIAGGLVDEPAYIKELDTPFLSTVVERQNQYLYVSAAEIALTIPGLVTDAQLEYYRYVVTGPLGRSLDSRIEAAAAQVRAVRLQLEGLNLDALETAISLSQSLSQRLKDAKKDLTSATLEQLSRDAESLLNQLRSARRQADYARVLKRDGVTRLREAESQLEAALENLQRQRQVTDEVLLRLRTLAMKADEFAAAIWAGRISTLGDQIREVKADLMWLGSQFKSAQQKLPSSAGNQETPVLRVLSVVMDALANLASQRASSGDRNPHIRVNLTDLRKLAASTASVVRCSMLVSCYGILGLAGKTVKEDLQSLMSECPELDRIISAALPHKK